MDKRNTLKRGGLICALVLLVAVLCFLANRNLRNFESSIIDQTQQHLLNVAKSEAQNIEEFVSDIQDELQMLSEDPRVRKVIAENACLEKCDSDESYYCELVSLFKHLRSRVNGVYSLSSKGIIQCCVPWKENRTGLDYSGKPGVKVVLQGQKPYVSEWFESSTGNHKSISVCQPVFYNDSFVGIVRAVIRLNTVAEMINHIRVGRDGYAWIMDNSGEVVAHPDPNIVSKPLLQISLEDDRGDEEAEGEVISSMLKGTQWCKGIFI